MPAELRCSSWARAAGVDPVGTAGCYAGLLLLELPLPWPRDVSEVPSLAPVVRAARDAGHRVQALVPRRTGGVGNRVMRYSWDPDRGRFTGVQAPADDVAETALALLEGERPEGTEGLDGVIDVLICGHGRRDRCCGSAGTELEAQLQVAELPGTVRVWRTSHTGGHRFAPTAIVLPHGTCWGYLDAPALVAITTRTDPPSAFSGRYRGCMGMPSPAVQALERAVLATEGWRVLDWPRRGEEIGDGVVELVALTTEGERRWRGTVVVVRTLPVPTCGQPLGDQEKTEAELSVVELEELAGSPGSERR